MSAGGFHTCVLVSTGLVECWGQNANDQLGNGLLANADVPVVTGL
jgi:hypothetical protein